MIGMKTDTQDHFAASKDVDCHPESLATNHSNTKYDYCFGLSNIL